MFTAIFYPFYTTNAMLHPIFPSRKPRTDWIVFALGALSLIVCFVLRDYWVFKPLETGINERLNHVSDSIITKMGMVQDSIEIMNEPSVDTEMLEAVKSQLGVRAMSYLDSADSQILLYRVKIRAKEKGSVGVNFSAGNRERSRTKSSQSIAEEDKSRTYWLNEHGNIVGETQRINEDLLRRGDTSALRERIIQCIPANLRPLSSSWKADTAGSNGEKISFSAFLSQDSLLKREMIVSAVKISSQPSVWSVEWQRRISLLVPPPPKSESASGVSVKIVVQIIFWVLVILSILGLLLVWVDRQRIKAVNSWILLIALLAGSSMTIALVSFGIPWYVLLIIFVIFTLGFGFFFIAVPIAGITSVMREVFAEKFYTVMRFWEKPLSSFHVGRMLLLGLSAGAIFSGLLIGLPFVGERLGIPSLAMLHLNAVHYTFPFMVRSEVAALLNTFGSTAPISFILLAAPAMLAYWLVPRKFSLVVALVLSSVAWGVFEAVQEVNFAAILVQAVFRAWIGFAVLYYADILAVLAFVLLESLLLSLGLFAVHPWLMMLVGMVIVSAYIIGIIAYRHAPEAVTESDYKPSFLTLLEENERMQQEIAAAKSVQQKLLPRSLPTFDSVVVSAACIPAYEVGGDYYDFFPLDDKRLGVLIGDVSGKGISAAFYITLAKGVIVSQVRNVGSPSDVLHRVNALLYGVMERGKFVSMIYGIYNTQSREFAFSNAGHNPLVVRRVNGGIQTISAKGMAIGLDKGERFERAVTTAHVTLEKGDCILLYTDGVTEAMNTDHAEYGEERMMQAIQAAPLNAADIVSAALADVRKFAGKAHQHDDITLVALQAV